MGGIGDRAGLGHPYFELVDVGGAHRERRHFRGNEVGDGRPHQVVGATGAGKPRQIAPGASGRCECHRAYRNRLCNRVVILNRAYRCRG